MCGRFTATAAFDVLAERFGITVDTGTNEELTARYNVAPSQTVPIITASEKGRRLVMAKWGSNPPGSSPGPSPRSMPDPRQPPRRSPASVLILLS
jgi:putative SOS response-associated peptidase YedK